MTFADADLELQSRWGAGGGASRVERWPRAALAALGRRLDGERERLALWLPVGLAVGVAFYFAQPAEPAAWVAPAGAVLGLATLLLVFRAGTIVASMGWFVACVAAGLLVADGRMDRVAAPVLDRPLGPVAVDGVIRSLTIDAQGRARLVLAVDHIERLTPERTPARVRLSLRLDDRGVTVGDRVRVRALLRPPPRPAVPGGYDFARRLYFERVGAVGVIIAPPVLAGGHAAPGRAAGLWAGIERLRLAAAARIEARLDGATAGVAIALATGLRAAIPEDALQALRLSGLQHLISISGLHMGMVAFGLFGAARLALVLVPRVGLEAPVKKLAALFAFAGALFYLLFSGASVPTQRAFVMVAFVLLAILVDRRALTMRTVAFTAGAVLLLAPESLFDAGFQMSFAAAIALIAAFEGRSALAEGGTAPLSLGARVWRYLSLLALSSLVAGLATAPIGAFHFQLLPSLSLLANMLALPVTGMLVMPGAMAALALMPLGLEAAPLWVMGIGVDVVLWVAHLVAGLPAAGLWVPAGPAVVLPLLGLGLLWLSLWRTAWRYAGLVPLAAAGLLWAGLPDRPLVLIDEEGRTLATRSPDRGLAIVRGRLSSFEAETWRRRDGVPAETEQRGARMACDGLGCTTPLPGGLMLALSLDQGALGEDCARADIVVRMVRSRLACTGPRLVLEGWALRRHGPAAIYAGGEDLRLRWARPTPGAWPWTPAPPPVRRNAGSDRRAGPAP